MVLCLMLVVQVLKRIGSIYILSKIEKILIFILLHLNKDMMLRYFKIFKYYNNIFNDIS